MEKWSCFLFFVFFVFLLVCFLYFLDQAVVLDSYQGSSNSAPFCKRKMNEEEEEKRTGQEEEGTRGKKDTRGDSGVTERKQGNIVNQTEAQF